MSGVELNDVSAALMAHIKHFPVPKVVDLLNIDFTNKAEIFLLRFLLGLLVAKHFFGNMANAQPFQNQIFITVQDPFEFHERVTIEVDALPSGLEIPAFSVAIEFPNVQEAIAFVGIEIEPGSVSLGTLFP